MPLRIPSIVAGIFNEYPHQAARNAILIFCGLLILSVGVPTFSRWLSASSSRPRRRSNAGNCAASNGPPPAAYAIQILHDDPDAAIDIIAVHGLAANPDYAWVWQPKHNPPGRPGYPTTYFNWLQELLPSRLSCRVMTFNYDSKWIMNAPQQRISNIADRLLDSLRNSRGGHISSRPIIFIGHSFGGNVIEQAIVSASRNDSPYSHITEATVGVVFLGTPHRGSRAASWGAILASLAPPGFTAEDRVLKGLEEHSDALSDRLRDFSCWLFFTSIPALCCFEQLATNYSSRIPFAGGFLPVEVLVVPEESACIDGHHKISLHADHLKLNKFYGAADPSFKLVYPEIERMVRNSGAILERRRKPTAIPTQESNTSGSLRKCLQLMRVQPPEDVLFEIRAQKGGRVEGTCEWILRSKEFSSWGADNNPRLLRLVGGPGIGKTMMSSFLVANIQEKVERSPGKAFAFFFCDDKDEKRKTAASILRSLIWQLLLQRTELFRHIESDF